MERLIRGLLGGAIVLFLTGFAVRLLASAGTVQLETVRPALRILFPASLALFGLWILAQVLVALAGMLPVRNQVRPRLGGGGSGGASVTPDLEYPSDAQLYREAHASKGPVPDLEYPSDAQLYREAHAPDQDAEPTAPSEPSFFTDAMLDAEGYRHREEERREKELRREVERRKAERG
jgi:hypothetical protein